MRRSRMIVALTEDVKRDLEQIAKEYGISAATLAAYAVGAFVRQHRITQPYLTELMQHMRESLPRIIEQIARDDLLREEAPSGERAERAAP